MTTDATKRARIDKLFKQRAMAAAEERTARMSLLDMVDGADDEIRTQTRGKAAQRVNVDDEEFDVRFVVF